jgi:long-chain acyl-CoA synthetase
VTPIHADLSASEHACSAFDSHTLCEAFQRTAARFAEQVALRTPDDAVSITWAQYAQRVQRLAAGLAALGVRRRDTIGIMLVNRPEFNLIDVAALHLGATPFSLYNTSAAEQIVHLFANAANRVLFTEPQFLPLVREAIAAGVEVEHVVLVDRARGEGQSIEGQSDEDKPHEGEPDGTISLSALEASGNPGFDFAASWRAVQGHDIATLIYTSGTTGPPKGVQLTHAGLMAQVRSMYERAPLKPGGRTTSFLPSAHLADRWLHHYQCSLALGFTITCVADPRTVLSHLPQVKPTAWGSVPRIWEKLKAALEAQGITAPRRLSEEQRAAIRAKLGFDQCEWLVTGGAPTPPEVLRFFADLGLEICELLGMSETSCVMTCNPRGAVKIGTCGPAIRGVELKLAEDGELLTRGEMIMVGYRADAARTREAIDADGWLHTGDIAQIDDDGYVTVVDRKKELIINAAGKNMSPANIEAALKSAHPLIGQAVVIGDRRPYNVALIVLDPDVGAAFAQEHALADAAPAALALDQRVQALVADAVEQANTRLSRVEQIKRHAILPVDWMPGGEELTPTMKLKRKPIGAKYASEIAGLYA